MKKQFFTVVFLLSASISFSQIKYSGGILTVGGLAPITHYANVMHGSLFLAATDAHTQFFQFDIFNGRIATNNNWCVFYNSQTSTFNDIAVGTLYQYSDARAKTNVKAINYGLSTISKLRPVSYNLIKNPSGENNHLELGLIAQELEQVMPELVRTDSEGKKLVNYNGLIPVLIKAVQELQKEVAELKAAK
ncbi:tail fiber domain-containing protein [Niabella aquatica]